MVYAGAKSIYFENSTLEEIKEEFRKRDGKKEFSDYSVYETILTENPTYISKDIALDFERLNYIAKKISQKISKKSNGRALDMIRIGQPLDDLVHDHADDNPETELFSEEELKILCKNVGTIIGKYQISLSFAGGYSLEEVFTASTKVNEMLRPITTAERRGIELSPFEKYLIVYSAVSEFNYKEEYETDSEHMSRDLVSVLNQNKMVCVGFAKLLKELCLRVDIPCMLQRLDVITDKKDGHMNNSIRLIDPKYGINGIYYADPCWDASISGIREPSKTLVYALMKYSDIPKIYKNKITIRLNDNDDERREYLEAKELWQMKQADERYVDFETVRETAILSLIEKNQTYTNLFEDLLADTCKKVANYCQEIKSPFPKDEEIDELCEAFWKDVHINGCTSDSTKESMMNIVGSMKSLGKTYGDIVEKFMFKAETFEPSGELLLQYMFESVDMKQEYGEDVLAMARKPYDEYKFAKDHATTITPDMLICALSVAQRAQGYSKQKAYKNVVTVLATSRSFIENSFNMYEIDTMDIENPVWRFGDAYSNALTEEELREMENAKLQEDELKIEK